MTTSKDPRYADTIQNDWLATKSAELERLTTMTLCISNPEAYRMTQMH